MVAANFEPVKRGQIYSAEARTGDGRYTRRYVRVVGVEVKAARAKLRECTRKGNKLRKERGDFSPDLVFKTELVRRGSILCMPGHYRKENPKP